MTNATEVTIEYRTVRLFIVFAIVCAISIPWAFSWHYTETFRAAVENGYVQKTLPGESGVYWVKR